ncbi:cyclin-domain-containing protein [Cristinia sonorae]|uniref:Cyclin-domain-containing protein n=1 Tax=Cristinia sonorae TaxID=1940300 RepID=A0A8K0XUU0_9AGAR|nr:cyclin-domain-containing protein [Cristinia sonorae]
MEQPQRLELPSAFEDVDVNILAELIGPFIILISYPAHALGVSHIPHPAGDMMERLLAHNDKIPLSPEALTRFHSRSAPSITVLDYLRRIVKFTNVEKTCLLITLHYIDQVCSRTPTFTLSSLTCHRFVITSIALSSKALCDVMCPNTLYAKVGGIPVGELNMLEREFLRMIDWRLTCTREVLQEYYVNLVRTHSTNKYFIPDPLSSSGVSSDSDADMEDDDSRPSSPATAMQLDALPSTNPSTILIDTTTLSPEPPRPPTVEQNMAFAAFQRHQVANSGGLGSNGGSSGVG